MGVAAFSTIVRSPAAVRRSGGAHAASSGGGGGLGAGGTALRPVLCGAAVARVVGCGGGSGGVVGSGGAASPSASGSWLPWGGGAARGISTKRRRVKKMNKHKYEKLKKSMRNLTAKNVRSK